MCGSASAAQPAPIRERPRRIEGRSVDRTAQRYDHVLVQRPGQWPGELLTAADPLGRMSPSSMMRRGQRRPPHR
jgi:hypothetical protein